MQLATSALSPSSTLSIYKPLSENNISDAASWVITRLSSRKERDFFRSTGQYHAYLPQLVEAITCAVRYIFIQEFEVPYIWMHKRDYISYFDVDHHRQQVELLNLDDLWRVYAVGQKYLSLLERRGALNALYTRLGVSDEYFERTIRDKIETAEMAADATEWLGMKYREQKKSKFDFSFHDDEEQTDTRKHKAPNRVSSYELAKKTIVSKLAEVRRPSDCTLIKLIFTQGFGIRSHEVVQNFISDHNTHFVEEQELTPLMFADTFVDPDATHAQSPDELLARARMIIATELGKDPLLRQEIRNTFKINALVSVHPTERGISKIDDHHPYFVSGECQVSMSNANALDPTELQILAAQERLRYVA